MQCGRDRPSFSSFGTGAAARHRSSQRDPKSLQRKLGEGRIEGGERTEDYSNNGLCTTIPYGLTPTASRGEPPWPADWRPGRSFDVAERAMAAVAATTIVLALTLNWRNDRLGFWVVGITDIPFILFVLIPTYAPWWAGLLGPVLWIAPFSVTGLARMGAPLYTMQSSWP